MQTATLLLRTQLLAKRPAAHPCVPDIAHPALTAAPRPRRSAALLSSRLRATALPGDDAAGKEGPSEDPTERLEQAAGELKDSLQEGGASVVNAGERAAADAQKQAEDLADAAVDVASGMAGEAADAVAGAVEGALDEVAGSREEEPGWSAEQAAVSAGGAPPLGAEQPVRLRVEPAGINGNGAHADAEEKPSGAGAEIDSLKQRLVAAVAGLDRGVAATRDDALRVENLLLQLEAAGGSVVLGASPESLEGRWRLVYSSAFASGSMGGTRAGPPLGLAPLILGPVYQDIYVQAAELDNVVELSPRFSLASLPGVDAKPPTLTLRLKHRFEVVAGNTVRITYDKTLVKTSGGLSAWLDSLPELATPSLPEALRSRGSATFDVTFVDGSMRVTRGDRAEVRIFLKEQPLF